MGRNTIEQFPLYPIESFKRLREASEENVVVSVLIGYGVIAVGVIGWIMIFYGLVRLQREQAHPTTFLQALGFFGTFLKVAIFISIEGGLFPLAAGFVLDYCCQSLFHIGVDASGETFFLLQRYPVVSLLVHWAFGIIYMITFACFVSWLRENFREGVLWFFRNPNDPAFDPLKDMINMTVFRHIRRLVLSVILYDTVLFLLIWAPIKVCSVLFPSILPLNVWFRELYEVPLDLLCFHIIIPFTLDNWQPSSGLKTLLKGWLHLVGWIFNLESYLFGNQTTNANQPGGVQVANPDPNQHVNAGDRAALDEPQVPVDNAALIHYPKYFGFRILGFLMAGTATLFSLNLTLIVLPISLGRFVLSFIFDTSISDIYTFTTGLYIIWGTFYLGRLAYKTITSHGLSHNVQRAILFTTVGLKWTAILAVWLGVIPMMVGLLFELTLFIPIRCASRETPNFFAFHDWALGLLMVKFWFRMVTLEAFQTSWMESFEKVRTNGAMGVKVVEVFKDILIPIMVPMLLLITAPYVAVRGFLPLIGVSAELQALCFQNIYFSIFCIYTLYKASTYVFSWWPSFKQSIIDEKFLVGQRLHNFQHGAER